MAMNKKVMEIVTERIINRITTEQKLPWHQPWDFRNAPINHTTLKAYRGINLWLLKSGHEYVTWNQLCDIQKQNKDVKLRKGSKAHLVVYFSFKKTMKDVTDADGNTEQKEMDIPFLRYYNVYDIEDIDGISPRRPEVSYEHNPIEEAEQIISSYLDREKTLKLEFNDGGSAFYRPATDLISVPARELYKNHAEYYSTLFHEMTHSTGHASRLNRLKSPAFFGDESYSKEELCAELGASMLCAETGIDNSEATDNSVAYLQGWLSALRNDATLIVSAAGKAQKAVEFILGETENNEKCYNCVTKTAKNAV